MDRLIKQLSDLIVRRREILQSFIDNEHWGFASQEQSYINGLWVALEMVKAAKED